MNSAAAMSVNCRRRRPRWSVTGAMLVMSVTSYFAGIGDACMRGKANDPIYLQCPADMDATASRRSASAMFSWSRENFVIRSTNTIKGLYQTVPHYGASSTIRRSFQEGTHFVEYKAVDETGNVARCSFYVTVRVNRCPAIYSPSNGVLTCDAGTLHGSRCSVSCIPGYSIGREPAELECLSDRKWSNDVPLCRMITCPDPATPLHGSRACTTTSHSYGSVCSFSCSPGYHLRGNDRLVCGVDGDWLSPVPVCDEIVAPKVVLCPGSSQSTGRGVTVGGRPLVFPTSGLTAEVPKPPVLFIAGDSDFDDISVSAINAASVGATVTVNTAAPTRRIHEIPHTCTHFGADASENHTFNIGSHWIVCTAVDERFGGGERAVSRCQFEIRVKANPCRRLVQPLNGFLLCARSHSDSDERSRTTSSVIGDANDLVNPGTCQLFCHRGYVPSRMIGDRAASSKTASAEYHCDQTGTWQPTDYVPSCVLPRRPHELKLPSELLYTSCSCAEPNRVPDFRYHFQTAVQSNFRLDEACRLRPRECIVEDVHIECHHSPYVGFESDPASHTASLCGNSPTTTATVTPYAAVTFPAINNYTTGTARRVVRIGSKKRGNRQRTDRTRTTTSNPWSSSSSVSHHQMARTFGPTSGRSRRLGSAEVRSGADRRQQQEIRLVEMTSAAVGQENRPTSVSARLQRKRSPLTKQLPYVLPIKFHFSTKVAESGGQWPDEFHAAASRLFAMFDVADRQFQNGSFDELLRTVVTNQLDDVFRIPDSPTSTMVRAVCDIGYQFNDTLLLCVPCGAGTYFDADTDRCVLCPPGTYQPDQAEFDCVKCPVGTASIEFGATNRSQCADIDECLSNPCLNNGLCENRHATYYCQCPPTYSGARCEEQVYDCRSHSCTNGATCQPTGASDYICLCKPSYFGEFCQFHTVDGGWSEWSDWAPCSRSCDGGVTLRNRSCDSPPPSNGGQPCDGAQIEERVCNQERCPECKKLRRPYQGTIHCSTSSSRSDGGLGGNDVTTTRCMISCQRGYTFSGAALPEYVCGRSTSYLWPHESPDNPRALLPACTERVEPESATFELRSSLQMDSPAAPLSIDDVTSSEFCSSINDGSESQSELVRAVTARSRQLAADLPCLRSGTCTLNAPVVTGCHLLTQLPDKGGNGSDAVDGVRRTGRTKRVAPPNVVGATVEISVSVTYKSHNRDQDGEGQSTSTSTIDYDDHDEYKRITEELSKFGFDLLKRSQIGALYVDVNGVKLAVDVNKTTAANVIVCPKQTVLSMDGKQCVRCGPGTFYSASSRHCVPCDVGSYQPESGQSGCLPCPGDEITYGRGAIFSMECYARNSQPPVLPENYWNDEPWYLRKFYGLLLAMFIVVMLLAVCFVVSWCRRNRRSEKYVVNSSRYHCTGPVEEHDIPRTLFESRDTESKERVRLCRTTSID